MFVFEWDDNKAKTNLKKNGVSFKEAQSVFLDENARIISDPDHSLEEDRFIILVGCHCYRDKENIIRIISARKATKT